MVKNISKAQIIIWVLFFCNIIIRFYRLADLVPYVYVDEAAIGYSSWCLANYGTDRYLNSYPLYIQNYFGGQSPAYAYLTALMMGLFGLNEFTTRFVNAFAYAAVYPFVYGIIKRTTSDEWIQCIVMGIYTFCPFLTIFSRIGLDCALLFPLVTAAVYFMVRAFETEETKYFVISSGLFSLSLYTYAISYIMIPLFLLFAFVYFYRAKKVTIKQAGITIGTFILIALPIAAAAFTLVFLKKEWSLGPITFTTMTYDRASEFELQNVFNNLKKMFLTLLVHECSIFTSMKFMNFFGLSIPFFFIGMLRCMRDLWSSWKERTITGRTIVSLLAISGMFCFLMVEKAYSYHLNGIIVCVLAFIGIGIESIIKTRREEILLIVSIGYIFSAVTFIDYYFISQEHLESYKEMQSLSEVSWAEVLEFYESNEACKGKELCIIGGDRNWIYIPFYLKGIDPNEVTEFDDTNLKGICDYSYKQIHVNPKYVKSENVVYAIANDAIDRKYDLSEIEKIKDTCQNEIKLTYYTIYIKEDERDNT